MKINLGVIGTGMAWERLHFPALSQLWDRYELKAMYDIDRGKAVGFLQKNNIDASICADSKEQLLQREDVEAVLVAVPIEDNYNIAEDALNAGKHVIAEKPFAATVEGAQSLSELAKKKSLTVIVAENYRFNEETAVMKDKMSAKEIGEPLYFINNNISDFESDMKDDTFAAKEWRQHPNFYGGTFLDSAIHDLARLRYLFGSVKKVSAAGRKHEKDYNRYMHISAQLVFESGVVGQYTYFCTGEETIKPPIGLRIFGTNGEIALLDKTSGNITLAKRGCEEENIAFTPDRGYYNEFASFYEVLRNNSENICTPDIEIEDIKLVMSIINELES